MKKAHLIITLFLLAGCSSVQQGNIPDAEVVEVSRAEPSSDCNELGPVKGTTSSVKGTYEDSLNDLKRDAAAKGANYVQLLGQSAMGTSASGMAYLCP